MNPFQPWQETIPLLAGARPRRRVPLGECFEAPEPSEPVKQRRNALKSLASRALLLLNLAALKLGMNG